MTVTSKQQSDCHLVTGSQFVNNHSDGGSGGILATGDLTISDSRFVGNRGDLGGGVRP